MVAKGSTVNRHKTLTDWWIERTSPIWLWNCHFFFFFWVKYHLAVNRHKTWIDWLIEIVLAHTPLTHTKKTHLHLLLPLQGKACPFSHTKAPHAHMHTFHPYCALTLTGESGSDADSDSRPSFSSTPLLTLSSSSSSSSSDLPGLNSSPTTPPCSPSQCPLGVSPFLLKECVVVC